MTAPKNQTVWREGDRIRRTDGTGYSDRVSDDAIDAHTRTRRDPHDPLFVPFARAVLAIREFERVAAGVSG